MNNIKSVKSDDKFFRLSSPLFSNNASRQISNGAVIAFAIADSARVIALINKGGQLALSHMDSGVMVCE